MAYQAHCKLLISLDMMVLFMFLCDIMLLIFAFFNSLTTSGLSYLAFHFHTSTYSPMCVQYSGPCTFARVLTYHSAVITMCAHPLYHKFLTFVTMCNNITGVRAVDTLVIIYM